MVKCFYGLWKKCKHTDMIRGDYKKPHGDICRECTNVASVKLLRKILRELQGRD